MKLIGEFMTQLVRDATSFLRIFMQNFVFPIDVKNHRVLVIWDLNAWLWRI